jgi:hypothetical protein
MATQELPANSSLKQMKFVGKANRYILQVIKQTEILGTYIDKKTEMEKKNKKNHHVYRIYDAVTGHKLLDWNNKYTNKENLRVLGFLVNKKVSRKHNNAMRDRKEESEYGSEDSAESQAEDESNYDEDSESVEEYDDE